MMLLNCFFFDVGFFLVCCRWYGLYGMQLGSIWLCGGLWLGCFYVLCGGKLGKLLDFGYLGELELLWMFVFVFLLFQVDSVCFVSVDVLLCVCWLLVVLYVQVVQMLSNLFKLIIVELECELFCDVECVCNSQIQVDIYVQVWQLYEVNVLFVLCFLVVLVDVLVQLCQL